MAEIKAHHYHGLLPRNPDFKITAAGTALDVSATQRTAFASYECDGNHELVITLPHGKAQSPGLRVLPLRHSDQTQIEGNEVRVTLAGPDYVFVEVPGLPGLFIYANAPAAAAPQGPQVTIYEAGKVYDVGEIILRDGETVWIEAGAVLRGNIRFAQAKGARVGGYGVLDGSYWRDRDTRRRSIVLDKCQDCAVEDIIMIHPTTWMLTIGASNQTLVQGIKQIGECGSSDGIDVVGSANTTVRGCCLRNGDDNVAVKALDLDASADASQQEGSSPYQSFACNVENLLVESCVCYKDQGGSNTEIGYETRCDHIRDIVFRDLDMIGLHGSGAIFGIHSGDRALVSNVTWENIRVDHHYDKLIDLRLLRSRWNRDPETGQIRKVVLRDIFITRSPVNEGYTINLIGGYDARHTVEGVTLENIVVDGQRLDSLEPLQIFVREASDIVIR